MSNGDTRITKRQREVISLFAQGMNGKQIAQKLGITQRVINKHISHACHRSGCNNRTHLVAELVGGRL